MLELADALGVSEQVRPIAHHDEYPFVWMQDAGVCEAFMRKGAEGQLSVPEFISRMYAEAEARKAPEKAVEPQVIAAAFVLKRLEALEAALDKHLQKHRETGL